MESRCYRLEEIPWTAVRPETARDVDGRPLLPPGTCAERVVITRVRPGGEFLPHVDPYPHVLYFLQGKGEMRLGDEIHPVSPGSVAEIPAGVRHAYRNVGADEMLLLTLNLALE